MYSWLCSGWIIRTSLKTPINHCKKPRFKAPYLLPCIIQTSNIWPNRADLKAFYSRHNIYIYFFLEEYNFLYLIVERVRYWRSVSKFWIKVMLCHTITSHVDAIQFTLVGLLVCWSVGLLVCWCVGVLVSWPVVLLVGRSVRWLVWSVYCYKLIVAQSLLMGIVILAMFAIGSISLLVFITMANVVFLQCVACWCT